MKPAPAKLGPGRPKLTPAERKARPPHGEVWAGRIHPAVLDRVRQEASDRCISMARVIGEALGARYGIRA